ncbi:MAG: hypothetical protein ACHQ52_01590 [Candidatus Eisenbacteria bacterium]
MNRIWVIAALSLAWVLVRVALRPLLALVFGAGIGQRALAGVPTTVRLTRGGDGAWKNADLARKLWEPLLAQGFTDAGTFVAAEVPGVVMRLLASSADSIMAIAYEHPQAGHWLELVTRYTDGRRCSATNMRDPGVSAPPNVTTLRAVGATPVTVLEMMRRKRPEGTMVPIGPGDVARLFEEGYAESMTWRQQHGITRGEVVKVAMRRAALASDAPHGPAPHGPAR